ncbi:hypothetical protein BGZ99_001337 [Dissophora globulifera]|uniref:Peroxisomal membrane protein PEX14 n=1 Tax=Dissophora globulifera TaxID=979702 RepID=A0A9P6RTK6_9FUNG|nr:hypothetical protein BGZ99_001337 [Dissophora globulifera]
MSDDHSSSSSNSSSTGATVDPVHQLLQANGNGVPGQALTAEQRNERREALLKRQRESREKAQQVSQAARANVAANTPATAAVPTTTSPVTATATATTATTAIPAVATPVADEPVRENMVQQAVSFLSSPNVQSADESKKTQFLEKKGLTVKEIELAKARVAGNATAPATSGSPVPPTSYQPSASPASSGSVAPPVPPRDYAPMQPYTQPVYIQQQPQSQLVADPNAFKRKLVIAMLISGGVTVLTSVIVQKVIYPMVRGITGARQKLAVTQAELLSKLKESLSSYKAYLLDLGLGSNRTLSVKRIKNTTTTVEDEEEEIVSDLGKTTTTTTMTKDATVAMKQQATIKQLDAFSQKLETHAHNLTFEQLKATRAMTQDLAEYITKETYALTSSIAYPTSRYYGYNSAGAIASGKGGLSDPTPESVLKSEIRSLKGLLLNWRNFPVVKDTGSPGSMSPGTMNGSGVFPNLVQQQ